LYSTNWAYQVGANKRESRRTTDETHLRLPDGILCEKGEDQAARPNTACPRGDDKHKPKGTAKDHPKKKNVPAPREERLLQKEG